MKTNNISLSPIQRRLWNSREEMKLYSVMGDHTKYLEAQRNYFRDFVSHPKAALSLPSTNSITAPLFTKAGFNIMKIMIKEIFRLRTDEDLLLAHFMKKIRDNQKLNIKL